MRFQYREMMRRIPILGVIICLLLTGCEGITGRLPWTTKSKKIVIARIFDKFLYLDDFRSILPAGTDQEDSTRLAGIFIDQWLKKQLMLDKAQLNLTPAELDIAKQIEEYRSALLIFRYQEQMVKAKLDTTVLDNQILSYYQQHSDNFSLPENLYLVSFLKIPVSIPDPDMVKRLLRSENEEDQASIAHLGDYPGARTDHYQNDWIPLSVMQKELPSGVTIREEMAQEKYQIIELEHENFVYLFYIRNIMFKEETPPLSYVKNSIKDFILSQRKIEFLTQLENELYEDGLKKNLFTIPNPKK